MQKKLRLWISSHLSDIPGFGNTKLWWLLPSRRPPTSLLQQSPLSHWSVQLPSFHSSTRSITTERRPLLEVLTWLNGSVFGHNGCKWSGRAIGAADLDGRDYIWAKLVRNVQIPVGLAKSLLASSLEWMDPAGTLAQLDWLGALHDSGRVGLAWRRQQWKAGAGKPTPATAMAKLQATGGSITHRKRQKETDKQPEIPES